MTAAREMHPDEVPHEYVMAAMKAAGLLHHDTARPALAAVLPLHRAEVLRQAVALVSLHVDLGAPPQRILTELRRMADATTPTSKEQQR